VRKTPEILQEIMGGNRSIICPKGNIMYRSIIIALTVMVSLFAAHPAASQGCPEEDPLQNYTGTGSVACPCFVAGEEAGAVFDAPSEHYPIQILRIGIGWASQYGGGSQQIEEAIRIYPSGLPDPGSPIAALLGPLLTDGATNEFDIEAQLGEVIVSSGPFTVTLKFMFDNVMDSYAPTVIHDGNGCQTGKNVVYAVPGGWYDACNLGITGDWIFYVVYRQTDCTTGAEDEYMLSTGKPVLLAPQPNPFSSSTDIRFFLPRDSYASIKTYDVSGRMLASVSSRYYSRGIYTVAWDGKDAGSKSLSSGIYFIELTSGGTRSVQKVILLR
jgi:hypothetical protein